MVYMRIIITEAEIEEGLRRFCEKNEYDFVVADVLGRNNTVTHRKALVKFHEDDDEDVEEAVIIATVIDNAYPYNDFDCDAYNAIAAKMCPELLHPSGAIFYW